MFKITFASVMSRDMLQSGDAYGVTLVTGQLDQLGYCLNFTPWNTVNIT